MNAAFELYAWPTLAWIGMFRVMTAGLMAEDRQPAPAGDERHSPEAAPRGRNVVPFPVDRVRRQIKSVRRHTDAEVLCLCRPA